MPNFLPTARDAVRSRLWPLPVVAVALAVAAGFLLPQFDAHVDAALPSWLTGVLFGGDADARRLRHDGTVPAAKELFSRTWHGSAGSPQVFLLYGSGQGENTLLAFARTACPGHTITAIRGRIPWEDGYAFFRRTPDRTLDEADLADAAAAVQRLLGGLQEAGRPPPLLLGY